MTAPENERNNPAQNTADDDLQRELTDALGSMNVESLMDYDQTPPSEPSTGGGSVKRGTVIAVQGDDIFVDLGGKSQGLITSDQFEDEPMPEVGQTIEATITGYDPNDGLLMLSRRGAVLEATWSSLSEGAVVEGRVKDTNKGGLAMDVNGIDAFMPISQISRERIESEDLKQFLNRRMRGQVVEIRRSERSIVVSHRAVEEMEAAQAAEQTFESLEEGQLVQGTVKTIMPYGAFVDIGGVDGLLHIGDMSHSRVEDPKEIVTEGQQIEVKVLKVDREQTRIGLGLKQAMPDPWAGIENKWPVDSVVTGRVTRVADFGAFVELEPGVEGLVPISEMTFERRIGHPSEITKEGEVIKVKVLNIEHDRKRISLSIKQVGDDPWMGASARWPVDSVVEAKVTRTADFGAFVQLTPGVEGLVHISELSENRVARVETVVRPGDTIKVKVLDVDEDRRRMSLSLKQATAAEVAAAEDAAAAEYLATKPKKDRKKPRRGGLDGGLFGGAGNDLIK